MVYSRYRFPESIVSIDRTNVVACPSVPSPLVTIATQALKIHLVRCVLDLDTSQGYMAMGSIL